MLSAEGVTVAHMGDIGQMLTDEQVELIGAVDILLVPVGGYYTVDAEGAMEIMRRLKPGVTMPMHYKNEYNNYPIATVELFVKLNGAIYLGRGELDITAEGIGDLPDAAVMEFTGE